VEGVGVSEEYSRSRTAWDEDCEGTDVSSVALGTLDAVVEWAIVVVSRVHQP